MTNILTSIGFSSAVIGVLVGGFIGGFFIRFTAYYTMGKLRKLNF